MRDVKQGFTLVEILIVLVIMAVLVGTAVLSVGSGLKSARLRDAARAVTYCTRHAKAVALLKQRPVVVSFEELYEGGDFVKSRISVEYSKDAEAGVSASGAGRGGGTDGQARTLSGALVAEVDADAVPAAGDDADGDPLALEPKEFEGVHVRAQVRNERDETRPRISVFSNVDALRRRSAEDAAKAKEKSSSTREGAEDNADSAVSDEVDGETAYSVVYEANGRCEPYTIRIWKEGDSEDSAITVNIGMFGRPVTEP